MAETTITDFDGYLMVFVLAGEGPGIWRITADRDAWCESCSNNPESGVRMYRTVSLTDRIGDPELGICQHCAQRDWTDRTPDREAPDATGARPHMYPPVK